MTFIIFLILLFILLSLIIRKINYDIEKKKNFNKKYSLEKDGFMIIKNFINDYEIKLIKNLIIKNKPLEAKKYILNSNNINNKIANIFSKGYKFQDFISIIKKSQFIIKPEA